MLHKQATKNALCRNSATWTISEVKSFCAASQIHYEPKWQGARRNQDALTAAFEGVAFVPDHFRRLELWTEFALE